LELLSCGHRRQAGMAACDCAAPALVAAPGVMSQDRSHSGILDASFASRLFA
jgi:hypothetical protein